MQFSRMGFGLLAAAAMTLSAGFAAQAETVDIISITNGARGVPATVVVPDGDGPFPAVVINHGHGGGRQEGGGFERLAKALADAGILSIRMDFPGSGDSTEPFTEGYLSNMISDSNASLSHLLANYPADPERLGILGYSMGGRIALTIAAGADNPYKAVGLLAPSSDPGKGLLLYFAGSEAEYERLYAEASGDKGYADYTTQWGQVQQLSKRWFDELLASSPNDGIAAYTGPMLIVHGDKDDVIKMPEVEALAAAYPAAAVVTVPEADHGYGFYSDQPDVSAAVEGAFATFFSENLK
jgi:dipeptidyl aminopeptidase/acylaminoacyl peptidase